MNGELTNHQRGLNDANVHIKRCASASTSSFSCTEGRKCGKTKQNADSSLNGRDGTLLSHDHRQVQKKKKSAFCWKMSLI